MDEQESKAWEGTASDLYSKLKEIVGEATTKGKEWPANAQVLSRRKNSLASTLRPFGIEITRHKRSGSIRHIEISARPESARKIAPIAPNAPNAAAGAERDDGLRHNTHHCDRRIRGWRRKRAQWAQFHGLFLGDR